MLFALALAGVLPQSDGPASADPITGVFDAIAAVAVVGLVLYAITFAVAAMVLELAISTLVLVLSRPFGAPRVYIAHAVATLVVVALALSGETIQARVTRLFEGPARPVAVTLYGDDLALVQVTTETAGEVWVYLDAHDALRNGVWSGGTRTRVPAGGGDMVVLLDHHTGLVPTELTVRTSVTGDESAPVLREIPLGEGEGTGEVPLVRGTAVPLAPATVTVADYDEGAARDRLGALPVSVCGRVATPGEKVTVDLRIELDHDLGLTDVRTTCEGPGTDAAACVEHLVGGSGWPAPPGERSGRVVVTYTFAP